MSFNKLFFLNHIEWLARGLTILLPVCIVLGHAYADITLCLISLLFLINSAVGRDWSWLGVRWIQVGLLLWIYMLLRDSFSEHHYIAFSRSVPFVRYIIFAAALSQWLLLDADTRKRLLLLVGAALCVLISDGFYQYFSGQDFLFGRPLFYLHDNTLRLTGPYSNPRLGIIIVCLGFPVLGQLLLNASTVWRGAGWILILLIGAIAFLSGERTTLPLFLAGVTLMLCIIPRYRPLCWIVIPIALLASGLFYVINSNVFQRQIISSMDVIFQFPASVYGQIWMHATKVFFSKPFFGMGGDHFRFLCNPNSFLAEMPPPTCNVHPHNFYLEWLTEYGLVGLILFLSMVGCWVNLLLKHRKLLSLDGAFLGSFNTLFVRLWPLAITTSFFANWTGTIFWLFVGWSLAYVSGAATGEKNR